MGGVSQHNVVPAGPVGIDTAEAVASTRFACTTSPGNRPSTATATVTPPPVGPPASPTASHTPPTCATPLPPNIPSPSSTATVTSAVVKPTATVHSIPRPIRQPREPTATEELAPLEIPSAAPTPET